LSEQDTGAVKAPEKTGATATPEADFSAALREATAAKQGDTAGAAQGDAGDKTKPAGTSGEADTKAPPADTAGKKPDESASADTAAGKQSQKSPKSAEIEIDWSKVRPALKAAYDAGTPEVKEALEAEIKGRLRAGKQVAQLKESLHTSKSSKRPPASTSGRSRAPVNLRQHLDGPKMKALEAEAPEVTAAVKEAFGPVIAEIENDQVARSNAELEADADFQTEQLAEIHPDWEDVTASEAFEKWLQGAAKHVKDMVARNAQTSALFPKGRIIDGQEAAMVLSLFKSSQEDSAGNEPPADHKSEGSQQQSPVDLKRQLQRETALTPDVRGVAAQSGVAEDDFSGALKEATRLKALQRSKATA